MEKQKTVDDLISEMKDQNVPDNWQTTVVLGMRYSQERINKMYDWLIEHRNIDYESLDLVKAAIRIKKEEPCIQEMIDNASSWGSYDFEENGIDIEKYTFMIMNELSKLDERENASDLIKLYHEEIMAFYENSITVEGAVRIIAGGYKKISE